MTDAKDQHTLEISRRFPAPRELVFRAWSSAEHLKRWFSPEGMTTPEAIVDFRPGGECSICMRAPDGQDFWSHGEFVEIAAPERLVMEGRIGDPPKFTAHTTVTFEDDSEGGTLLKIRQVHTILDPAFIKAVEGAPEGWRTTLDKLEREVARLKAEG